MVKGVSEGIVKGISVIWGITEQIPYLGELFCRRTFAKFFTCFVYQADLKLTIDFSFFLSVSVER